MIAIIYFYDGIAAGTALIQSYFGFVEVNLIRNHTAATFLSSG